MIKLIWQKILLSIGVLLITTTTVTAQVGFDMIPGNFVRQGNIIWSCLVVPRIAPVCAPINIKQFCQIDKRKFEQGILSCVRPLMAEENQEQES